MLHIAGCFFRMDFQYPCKDIRAASIQVDTGKVYFWTRCCETNRFTGGLNRTKISNLYAQPCTPQYGRAEPNRYEMVEHDHVLPSLGALLPFAFFSHSEWYVWRYREVCLNESKR